MIVSVVIDIKHRDLNQVYDYIVPTEFESSIQRGMRVIVPFTDNNLERLGFVVDVKQRSASATKYIKEILDLEPIVDDEFFLMLDELTKLPSNLIASSVEAMLPQDLLIHYVKKITLLNQELVDDELISMFNTKNEFILKKKDQKIYPKLKRLSLKGAIKIETILLPKVKKDYIYYLEVKNPSLAKTPKQKEVISLFGENQKILKSSILESYSSDVIKRMVRAGILEETSILKRLEGFTFDKKELNPLDLKLQKDLDLIELNEQSSYLIEGHNKDSKAFLNHFIRRVVDQNQQVLILVPERFMVNPLKEMLASEFTDTLVLAHSSDSTFKERYLNQENILANDAKIIVASRLGIFTQFKNLGAIIISSSHDDSYYPFEGLYYDVFKLAKLRSKYHNIPLILNTHTKTMSDELNISKGHFIHIDLSSRDIEPKVTLVDMKDELKQGNTKMLSKHLKSRLDETLEQNLNSLLILNQKGYAPFVMCRSCSYVPKDPTTNIPLNYVEKTHMLRSQLTKHQEPFTKTCPKCGKEAMKPVGAGIELLKNYITKTYPDIEIIQIDKDTISTKETYEIIKNTKPNDKKIFIGTQLALKSSFKDKISLVSILVADSFLKLPRYDANEIAFKLFSDAKNIAKDELIIQSYDTNHFVLNALSTSKDIYYKEEMSNRRLSKMPPYNKIMQVRVSSDSYLKVHQYAHQLKQRLKVEGIECLGPVDSNLLKQNDKYQVLLLIKYQNLSDTVKDLLVSNNRYQVETNPLFSWY